MDLCEQRPWCALSQNCIVGSAEDSKHGRWQDKLRALLSAPRLFTFPQKSSFSALHDTSIRTLMGAFNSPKKQMLRTINPICEPCGATNIRIASEEAYL